MPWGTSTSCRSSTSASVEERRRRRKRKSMGRCEQGQRPRTASATSESGVDDPRRRLQTPQGHTTRSSPLLDHLHESLFFPVENCSRREGRHLRGQNSSIQDLKVYKCVLSSFSDPLSDMDEAQRFKREYQQLSRGSTGWESVRARRVQTSIDRVYPGGEGVLSARDRRHGSALRHFPRLLFSCLPDFSVC